MNTEDEFKYLVGGYFGVREMDEYDLKEYILEEIKKYIEDFVKETHIDGYDYKKVAQEVEDKVSLRTKLQDSLLILNKIEAPLELKLMINRRLEKMKHNEE